MHSTTPNERQQGWFATTHWSMVVSAGRGDAVRSREAMERLCESYWVPLYSYVRRRGYAPEDAQDLTQEFFTRLLGSNKVASADQQKGRFRSFLLTSLKHFLSDEWDKSRAQKRGGGAIHCSIHFDDGERTYELEPVNNVTPEQVFERRWALTLLDNVLHHLQAEHEAAGKGEQFRLLSPCLVGERTAQPYAELAEAMGLSEGAVKSAVHRMRARYRELLRKEISNTVVTEAEVDEELKYLFTVLARQ